MSRFLRVPLCLALLFGLAPLPTFADEPAAQSPAEVDADKKKAELLIVPDEPKTVDPATIVPELVARKGTVAFESASLLDVAAWLREEMQIPVMFEQQTIGFSLEFGATVNDRLDDAPVYQLLDRLALHKLRWHIEDGVVYLVGEAEAGKRLVTTSYNLGDLLDAGYDPDRLSRTITYTIRGKWDASGKTTDAGSLVWLGDVLFVRQTHEVQRHVVGLLQALRKHGRRTWVYEPLEHERLRAKLEERVTVDFAKVPLDQAIRDLAEKSEVDLRFDRHAVEKHGNSLRSPVTLQLADQKLHTVLRGLLRDFQLTVILENGILSITPNQEAEKQYKTAAYYVNDLCQTEEETIALMQAISQQTAGDAAWNRGADGKSPDFGVIVFARVGTMVIRQRETVHEQILALLENYRAALRQSKPRQIPGSDPREVITRYYRMHADMAAGLNQLLPVLVEPGSWHMPAIGLDQPEQPGTILSVASRPEIYEDANTPEIPHAVLIIKHRREVHDEIIQVLQRVSEGDEPFETHGNFGQQGGFGQGFF